ncbi:lysine decarboxylase [Gracilibacillus ureilyticus]|uniref:Lysine decarboxylase n=1 Tax=Gracilibacillus ureilyticus TaxID=531814 RepID=A0A1H9VPX2_9BACI|nr:aminotransferase class I/II-fold pyridoxal phosphate-dependent enzyme [Gracilibacillus ureilyticus]SES23273.1 lysine decarboxylase [Gracilibacillus ureilyticus]
MQSNQARTPLLDKAIQHIEKFPYSFHVPGHKNGQVTASSRHDLFKDMMRLDLTEIPGLDDLHAPDGVIQEAETLAADWFQTGSTFFLVNGSTVGNLAMILATCEADDLVLVQRNCHKSVLNGLELAGARPVFLAPQLNPQTNRYEHPSYKDIVSACKSNPDAKALILTYPDYFGKIFELEKIIKVAHEYDIPVLVDEAHGCHFSVPFFEMDSAVHLGADIVVQSAHKMTPALTMGAFLHISKKTGKINKQKVAHYLQLLQSSSPSYLIMISLDIARFYLANYTKEQYNQLMIYLRKVRHIFRSNDFWDLEISDDPLKLVLKAAGGVSTEEIMNSLELEGLIAEMKTDEDILLVFGMEPHMDAAVLEAAVEKVKANLKKYSKHVEKHDKIENNDQKIIYRTETLSLSYQQMKAKGTKWVELEDSVGYVAADTITPYPPGIPLIAKGERITSRHVGVIKELQKKKISFQPSREIIGLYVFE